MREHKLGIYEKALPGNLSWAERLAVAKACGFDFVEMSVDEQDHRLARLDWDKQTRIDLVRSCIETGITIPSMCLSGHRRFPLGSHDPEIRKQARVIMDKAIQLAVDCGIRTIQLAGYDVYYEQADAHSKAHFVAGIQEAVKNAASCGVMLAMEIMDTEFMSTITRWKALEKEVASPWFCVYPDVGNLSAWTRDVEQELTLGIDRIVALHLKDTYAVTDTCPGQFRDVPFGEGCVDFVDIFKILQKLNYRGAFMIEMWTEKAEDPLAEIIHARKWIEQKMQEGGFVC